MPHDLLGSIVPNAAILTDSNKVMETDTGFEDQVLELPFVESPLAGGRFAFW